MNKHSLPQYAVTTHDHQAVLQDICERIQRHKNELLASLREQEHGTHIVPAEGMKPMWAPGECREPDAIAAARGTGTPRNAGG